MSDSSQIDARIDGLFRLMRTKLKVRGRDFPSALEKGGRLLPKAVRKQAQVLADAIPLSAHPKLRATLDHRALERAARDLETHLEAIDLAEQRKSYWLGVLGTIAFNLLLIIAALIVFALWQSS